MRRSGLPVPKPQDVCIFCSARWILAPTSTPSRPRPQPRSRPRLPRRSFTSGKTVHQPPATATATATATTAAQAEPRSQNDEKVNGPARNHGGTVAGAGAGAGAGASSSAFPQSAGGWAQKPNFMSDFKVKKQEVKNPDSALLNSALSGPPAGGRHGGELPIRFVVPHLRDSPAAMPVGEKAMAEANGTHRGGNVNGTRQGRTAYGSLPNRGKWKCDSCGHMNTTDRYCKKCRSLNFTFRPADAPNNQTERKWGYLKYIEPTDVPKPVLLMNPDVKGSIKSTSKLDQSREERLAQTKDGQFVGFRSSAAPAETSPPSAVSRIRFNDGRREDIPKSQVFTGVRRIDSRRAQFTPAQVEPAQVTPAYVASIQYESNQPDKGSNRKKGRKQAKSGSRYADEDDEDDGELWDKIEEKRQRKKERAARKSAAAPTSIMLPEYISVANLAIALRVPLDSFGAKMDELGFEDTNHDHILDAETAGLIASEFNYAPITITPDESHDIRPRPPIEDKTILPPRPPVVTIMGHVDHGKTTLLDWLRKSSVAASEYGGITQHIGAFSVSMPSGRLITFLDTPGHAAFLDMRQRGANVTDVVILVVAADDSVKPQTLEALKHAQTAKVPIIVAVNKIDKEGVDVDRVKKDLSRYGVEIEDYGGDTQVVLISGKTGQGMLGLEEAVIALADQLDVRAEKDGAAEGWVLEATKRKAGRAATVLVSQGTIRPGDIIVAGSTWTKARTLRDASGARVLAAGPGAPVEIDGWREQPKAGDQVLQAKSEQQAKSAVDYRIEVAARNQMVADMAAHNEARRAEQQKRERERERELQEEEANEQQQRQQQQQEDQLRQSSTENESASGKGSGEEQATKSQPGTKDVYFIIKADVSGSVEAVSNSISALSTSEVRPQIISSGVGPVTEFEIDHVGLAGGRIISFNLAVEPSMVRRADQAGVEIISHNIIYRLVDDVKARLIEYLPPIITQRVLGEAEIAQIFHFTVKQQKGKGKVPFAGCKVRNGSVVRKEKVRVMRKGKEVYNGSLSSMKQLKKDVSEMHKGTECGLGFEGWAGFEVGDVVQSFEEKSERRTVL